MNEIEEKFFKCFGIEPEVEEVIGYRIDKETFETKNLISYPKITDSILLELIEILREHYKLVFWKLTSDGSNHKCLDICGKKRTDVLFRTGNNLKYAILSSLICMQRDNEKLKHQVQSLFKVKNRTMF